MNINICQADVRDVEVVYELLCGAAAWLAQRGIPMWRANEFNRDRIADEISNGLYFVAENDGEPAGTIRFQLSDPIFWPDMSGDDAAYVHRLAVRRRFAGGEVSTALLSWAEERARSLGRRFLRLDCEADRTRLRAVYESFGFQYHSERQVGPYYVARYQYLIEPPGVMG